MVKQSAERKRETRRRYYQANREQIIAKTRAYQDAHPAAARETKRRWHDANPFARHGMRPMEWATMFAAQQGQCYLCGDELSADRRKSVIDHDHSCCPERRSCGYCRRGIACMACNTLIGLALDDPERLHQIADNLQSALVLARQRIAVKPTQEQLFGGLTSAAEAA